MSESCTLHLCIWPLVQQAHKSRHGPSPQNIDGPYVCSDTHPTKADALHWGIQDSQIWLLFLVYAAEP